MKLKRTLFVVSFLCIGLVPISTYAKEPEKLVREFCYALQATSVSHNLNMRLDTESKIEAQVGGKFRGPQKPYNSACMEGLNQAFDEEGKGLCQTAWEKYGCSGTEVPRLLQESPFGNRDGIFCKY